MRLKIASRRSDLARLQAYRVAEAIRSIDSKIQIEFQFKASLGDLDLDSPLMTMGNKGVFTQDFYQDLIDQKSDLVVHSWKDLPTAENPLTEIAATLPRADSRDLLLVRKDCCKNQTLQILSSSPRRIYNLKEFVSSVWPARLKSIEFKNVRGNIPTRLKKLLTGDGDALVVAKAALDRLLTSHEPDLAEAKAAVALALQSCEWMVLPFSVNPCAPAQGALAIEIRKDREDLKSILNRINHQETFSAVEQERKILAGYGGGCHQKIGVNVVPFSFGQVWSLRGLTESGKKLHEWKIVDTRRKEFLALAQDRLKTSGYFPSSLQGNQNWFRRTEIDLDTEKLLSILNEHQSQSSGSRDWGFWVARESAVTSSVLKYLSSLSDADRPYIWTAGVSTWRALAAKGLWVNGCSEGLGESWDPGVEQISAAQIKWIKLTHSRAIKRDESAVATYHLEPEKKFPDLNGYGFFYWMSGSSFELALTHFPEVLAKGIHSCGPGKTAIEIERLTKNKPFLFTSWEEWSTLLKSLS